MSRVDAAVVVDVREIERVGEESGNGIVNRA
jgi:hypothetical protein